VGDKKIGANNKKVANKRIALLFFSFRDSAKI
jgi:hypothetical protein